MTEIFNALSVMEAPLSDEDRVIYLVGKFTRIIWGVSCTRGQCRSPKDGCGHRKVAA